MKRIRVYIVEDQVLLAEDISFLLKKIGHEVIGIAHAAKDAINEIKNAQADLVLVDINLNKDKAGLRVGDYLDNELRIPFIYLTSHTEQSVVEDASRTHPYGYLVKPASKDSLYSTIEIAMSRYKLENEKSDSKPYLVLNGNKNNRLQLDDICFLKADGNYTKIYTVGDKILVETILLKDLLEQLKASDFLRIHKSYVVNKKFIDQSISSYLVCYGNKLSIGRKYRDHVKEAIKSFKEF